MQFLIIGILFSAVNLCFCTPLLDCIMNCDKTSVGIVQLAVCKNECYKEASKGGYQKNSYQDCLDVCKALPKYDDRNDCFMACELFFPYLRHGKQPTTSGPRAKGWKRKKTEAPTKKADTESSSKKKEKGKAKAK